MAERHLEAIQKNPPDENRAVQAAVRSTLDGIEVVIISEVKDGKLEETLDLTVKTMVMF